MGDAAGKLAHSLHLLRLGKLQFQVFLLGDISKIQHGGSRPFARAQQRRKQLRRARALPRSDLNVALASPMTSTIF